MVMADMSNPDGESNSKTSLKRPRPVISCLSCRKKKLKCDRSLPCQQCVKGGRATSCSFQPGQEPDLRPYDDEPAEKRSRLDSVNGSQASLAHVGRQTQTNPTSLTGDRTTLASSTGFGLFEQLENRVTQLETLVGAPQSANSHRNQSHDVQTPVSLKTPAPSRPQRNLSADIFPSTSTFLTTWLNSSSSGDMRARRVAADLRCIHQSLEVFHYRASNPNKSIYSNIFQLIPSQSTCQVLTELYFDNLEHCFRILHRPTFDRQLDTFFQSGNSSTNSEFLPHLVAVIAISSSLGIQNECLAVDESQNGDLTHIVTVFLQDYLHRLGSHESHTLPALQTRMLLLLLRWLRLDKMSDLWELSGQILRQAMNMKLDVDPSELPTPFSTYEAEIRRRLWITICEEDMMVSILGSMPCLVPDFTCRLPLNVDDDELESEFKPESRPFDIWTDAL
jgi:Fungal specific transcription factor domain/Fungal Zn(2)-Cys(6) binuclear cluster domain